ncbi:hypothetical protein HGRIS_013996 [Hohenbuehelia grisea]|uniref:Uncharacterized protein n=1 Tax=Hohenbuehelia grisea TaxID=104357 RepID=A0ABR3JS77_9AGAR
MAWIRYITAFSILLQDKLALPDAGRCRQHRDRAIHRVTPGSFTIDKRLALQRIGARRRRARGSPDV